MQRLSPNAFALSGRTLSPYSTQGDALGYVLVAPSGRALNACYPMVVNMPSSRYVLQGNRRSRHVLKGQHAFKERIKGKHAFKERAEGPTST